MFDIARITADTFVRCVEYFDELASTNDYALRIAGDESLVTPLVVLAGRQTAGRGRGANRWWSAPGALTFSLVWDLPASVNARFASLSSLIAALAVCETIESLVPRHHVAVKWPNDVYLEGKKVSGMLIETPSRPAGRTVFGIGLNVNNSFRDAPAELHATATSLIDCQSNERCLTNVLCELLSRLESRLERFVTEYAVRPGSSLQEVGNVTALPPTWHAAWRMRCFLSDRVVTIEDSRRTVTGVCLGVNHDGALQLRTPTGIEQFVSGTVRAFS